MAATHCPYPYVEPDCKQTIADSLGSSFLMFTALFGSIALVMGVYSIVQLVRLVRFKGSAWSELPLVHRVVYYCQVLALITRAIRVWDLYGFANRLPYLVYAVCASADTVLLYFQFARILITFLVTEMKARGSGSETSVLWMCEIALDSALALLVMMGAILNCLISPAWVWLCLSIVPLIFANIVMITLLWVSFWKIFKKQRIIKLKPTPKTVLPAAATATATAAASAGSSIEQVSSVVAVSPRMGKTTVKVGGWVKEHADTPHQTSDGEIEDGKVGPIDTPRAAPAQNNPIATTPVAAAGAAAAEARSVRTSFTFVVPVSEGVTVEPDAKQRASAPAVAVVAAPRASSILRPKAEEAAAAAASPIRTLLCVALNCTWAAILGSAAQFRIVLAQIVDKYESNTYPEPVPSSIWLSGSTQLIILIISISMLYHVRSFGKAPASQVTSGNTHPAVMMSSQPSGQALASARSSQGTEPDPSKQKTAANSPRLSRASSAAYSDRVLSDKSGTAVAAAAAAPLPSPRRSLEDRR